MNTIYHAIARLLWHIYLTIERRRPITPPDLYIDRQGRACTIDAAGNLITFGVRHD